MTLLLLHSYLDRLSDDERLDERVAAPEEDLFEKVDEPLPLPLPCEVVALDRPLESLLDPPSLLLLSLCGRWCRVPLLLDFGAVDRLPAPAPFDALS